jgi:hypothetical protein
MPMCRYFTSRDGISTKTRPETPVLEWQLVAHTQKQEDEHEYPLLEHPFGHHYSERSQGFKEFKCFSALSQKE